MSKAYEGLRMTLITHFHKKEPHLTLYELLCLCPEHKNRACAIQRCGPKAGEVIDGEVLESLSQLGGLAIWICFPCLITGNAGTTGAGDHYLETGSGMALGRTPALLALLLSCNTYSSLC